MSAAGQAKQQKNLADLRKQSSKSTYVAAESLRTFGRQQFFVLLSAAWLADRGPASGASAPLPHCFLGPSMRWGPLFFTTSADGT